VDKIKWLWGECIRLYDEWGSALGSDSMVVVGYGAFLPRWLSGTSNAVKEKLHIFHGETAYQLSAGPEQCWYCVHFILLRVTKR
jgi:hypothetical protein